MAKAPSSFEAVKPQWAIAFHEARKRKGFTQARVASELNVSQGTVTDWERGKNKPRAELWTPIAMLLNIDFSKLLLTKEQRYLIRSSLHRYGEFLEQTSEEQYEVMLFLYEEALTHQGVVLPPVFFALVFHKMWGEATNASIPPSQHEARMLEAIRLDVAMRSAISQGPKSSK